MAEQFGELDLFLAVEQRTVGLSCTKLITAKHQSVFWLVSQSRCMSAICVGTCRWISLVATSDDPVSSAISVVLQLQLGFGWKRDQCHCQPMGQEAWEGFFTIYHLTKFHTARSTSQTASTTLHRLQVSESPTTLEWRCILIDEITHTWS